MPFLNSKQGWLVGSGGIHKTNDGGNTWDKKLTCGGVLGINKYFGIQFPSLQYGWAMGGNYDSIDSIAKTVDGEETWYETLKMPTLNALEFENKLLSIEDEIYCHN